MLISFLVYGQVQPISTCNDPCYPGYRKIEKEGENFCCYICDLCPGGMVADQRGEQKRLYSRLTTEQQTNLANRYRYVESREWSYSGLEDTRAKDLACCS